MVYTKRLLRKGSKAYLAYMVDTQREVPNLQDVPIVNKFEDVFPQDLPGLPPNKEIKFAIELALETVPVSKAPYRLASLELKEATQLQELLEKGKANMVDDALSRKEKLKMIMSSEELIRKFEKMKIEVKVTENGTEKLFEIAMQPKLLEKIILFQERMMSEGTESMTGEEINTEKDDKGILRYSYKIWVPNVQELKDEILYESHSSRYSIHPRSTKMYRDLKK
ncbi:hypothetical protein AgCh_033870 [Apium graveolens]